MNKWVASRSSKIIGATLIISVTYFIAVILNISPFLRGPNDSHIESHWPYYFVNTYSRLWIFIPIFLGYFLTFQWIERKKKIKRFQEMLILIVLSILTVCFQLGLVYFSRFGITVLFRRLVDPGINGYFSSAIKIHSVTEFLRRFPYYVNHQMLSQHASGHPPGSLLVIHWLLEFIAVVPVVNYSFLNQLHIHWAQHLWEPLTTQQKLLAIILPFLLHVIASVVIIPFYFLAKQFFGDIKTAFRSTFLYAVIPSLSFFAVVFDPLYAVFPILITLFLFLGVRKNNWKYLFLSGIIAGVGLFFTAVILTILVSLGIFSSLTYFQYKNSIIIKRAWYFLVGFLSVIGILFLFQYNTFTSMFVVIHGQIPRDYLPWVFFNPYDFFVFLGIPISIPFIFQVVSELKKRTRTNTAFGRTFYTFWVTFIALIISGTSRGEVGRIWLPFMFIPMLLVSNFFRYNLKLSKTQFFIIFTLVFLQVLILEEYWVPVW